MVVLIYRKVVFKHRCETWKEWRGKRCFRWRHERSMINGRVRCTLPGPRSKGTSRDSLPPTKSAAKDAPISCATNLVELSEGAFELLRKCLEVAQCIWTLQRCLFFRLCRHVSRETAFDQILTQPVSDEQYGERSTDCLLYTSRCV